MRRLQYQPVQITRKNGKSYIVPYLRSDRLLVATPEEFVRQSVMKSLVLDYGYPVAALAAEEAVTPGIRGSLRTDIVVYVPAAHTETHQLHIKPFSEAAPDSSYSDACRSVKAKLDALPRAASCFDVVDVPENVMFNGSEHAVVGFDSSPFERSLAVLLRLPGEKTPFPCLLLGEERSPEEIALAETLSIRAPWGDGTDDEELLLEPDSGASLLLQALGSVGLYPEGVWYSLIHGGFAVVRHADGLGQSVAVRVGGAEEYWKLLAAEHHERLFMFGPDERVSRPTIGEPVLGSEVLVESPSWTESSDAEAYSLWGRVLRGEGNEWFVKTSEGTVQATLEFDHRRWWVYGAPEPLGTEWEPRPEVSDDKPFIVVECKRDDVFVDASVRSQGAEYAIKIGARYLVTTNGTVANVYAVADNEKLQRIDDIPTFAESGRRFDAVDHAETHKPRPPLGEAPDPNAVYREARRRDLKGALASKAPAFLRFDDALNHAGLVGEQAYGIRVLADNGWQLRTGDTPTNRRLGLYRLYEVEDSSNTSWQLGLSCDMMQARLRVGVVDKHRLRLALTRSLDSLITVRGGAAILSDGGRMSSKKRKVTTAGLQRHVKGVAPELLTAGGFDLGSLPIRSTPTETAQRDVVLRLLAYAILREQYKGQGV